jgi:hypothetical protein
MTCLLYWLTGLIGEDFKTFFPIGSCVKTTVCLLKVAILDGGQGHQWFQSVPVPGTFTNEILTFIIYTCEQIGQFIQQINLDIILSFCH